MKKRPGLSTMFVFLLGIAIGIAVILICGIVIDYTDYLAPLTSRPKTFGDIKIWVQKPLVTKEEKVPKEFYQEHVKELVMAKDDVVFLRIAQSQTGKVGRLYLSKNDKEPVFYMMPWNTPSGWGRATYSKSSGAGYAVGDVFIDIDFDGRFDFKMVMDNEGKLISRSIYIEGLWLEVDRANIEMMKAAIEKVLYTFDPNISCWQLE